MDSSESGLLSLQERLILHRYKRDILDPARSAILEGDISLF